MPDKVVIDKGTSNAAGLFNMNCLLVMHSWFWLIDVLQVNYLNNIIEQDQRFLKKITRPMQTFKSFNSAAATRGHRSRSYDPQRTIRPTRAIRLGAIRGVRWIIVPG